MTPKQKNLVLSILGGLFAISFFLPVLSCTEEILPGFYCALSGSILFMIHLDSGDILALLLDSFLMLPNLLMIATFLLHKKFRPWLKYLFCILATISAGSWIFTYRTYFALEEEASLHLGYWFWFLSLSSYLLIQAIPAKKSS